MRRSHPVWVCRTSPELGDCKASAVRQVSLLKASERGVLAHLTSISRAGSAQGSLITYTFSRAAVSYQLPLLPTPTSPPKSSKGKARSELWPTHPFPGFLSCTYSLWLSLTLRVCVYIHISVNTCTCIIHVLWRKAYCHSFVLFTGIHAMNELGRPYQIYANTAYKWDFQKHLVLA